MKLVSLKVKNFRSYRAVTELPLDDFTALIGRNDVGKSTLLEAMEIFFNQQVVKIDQNDACVHSTDRVVEIAGVFEELPSVLTLDARSETTLAAEWLLNNVGQLEIVKRYDCRAQKPREEIFAWARTSNDTRLRDLLRLKNVELKTRARELECIEGVDQRSNAALRAAIRIKVGESEIQELLVPLNEEDGKKAWEQIERAMPTFALFQADRPSKDDDPEVADPMKIAVAAAVNEIEADLEAIKNRVRQGALDVARRTLAKLREMDPALAQELTPTFKAEPKWDGFKLTLTGDDQIPINKRGSGVRRLILLSFFRAEAERRSTTSSAKRVIYAIEEPESSQHPNSQVLLIQSLLALANDPNTQVIITTHVPAIAALVPTTSVRLLLKRTDQSPEIERGGDDVYRRVADTLGVLPDRRAKVAVYVEGPNDVEFLRAASRLHRAADNSLIDLDTDHRIAFVPTGGGNLQHWVDQRYLSNAGLTEVHIYDTDDRAAPKYRAQVNAVNARGGRDIAFLTAKRELENYIHDEAIRAEYGFAIVIDD
jgi:putative ATP-dependent endonuclease of OLD family